MTGDRPSAWAAYRLRWTRRKLLWRAFRSRHALSPVHDRTAAIGPSDILCLGVLRNEELRLPWFLRHYRRLGVGHFLLIDNASTDGTPRLLSDQPDVSVWRTGESYRDARFGLDWLNHLLARFGHDRWCLTVDADELLTFAHDDTRDLHDLTRWLDGEKRRAFGALMLDLYPEGPVGPTAPPGNDPIPAIPWFDPGPYRVQRQAPMRNLWVQGGPRDRLFFAAAPERAPTLNKLPLMRWNRRWAYVNSTHAVLPARLNLAYDGPGGTQPSGVLLHTKFLGDATARAAEDLERRQHFHDPDAARPYLQRVLRGPVLRDETSQRHEGWRQLVDLGLMTPGGW